MIEFSQIEGELHLGESSEEYENMPNNLYNGVVFVSEEFIIKFSPQWFPVDEQHFETVGETTLYYPYYNETHVELAYDSSYVDGDVDSRTVSIEVGSVNDMLVVRSESEVSYGQTLLVINNEAYHVSNSLLFNENPSVEDTFLGINSVENPVLVTNLETGACAPIEYSVLEELFDNTEKNGLLEVHDPSYTFSEHLSDKF